MNDCHQSRSEWVVVEVVEVVEVGMATCVFAAGIYVMGLECTDQRGWACAIGHCEGQLGVSHRRLDPKDPSACARACNSHAAFTVREPQGCFCWHTCRRLHTESWQRRAASYVRLRENVPTRLEPPPAHAKKHNIARLWLGTAVHGYCASQHVSNNDLMKGRSSSERAPCESSGEGTFRLRAAHLVSWETAVSQCLRLCNQCQNCEYISVSLRFQDCSWFDSCPLGAELPSIFPGFRSGRAIVLNASVGVLGRRRRRQAAAAAAAAYLPRTRQWSKEMSTRFTQVAAFAARSERNLSGLLTLLAHPSVQPNLWRGVRLAPSGKRWAGVRFEQHVVGIYQRHNKQSAPERARLQQVWSAPLIGHVQIIDLLLLLHFTIDHTDNKLRYTSQLIHCLQVYHAVKAHEHAFGGRHQHHHYGTSTADHLRYRRDMRVAALVHDLGTRRG